MDPSFDNPCSRKKKITKKSVLREVLQKKRMVFILAASSLHHAIETLTPDENERYESKIVSIPGLCLNPNTKNPKKIVQNLLSKDLKDKKDIVIWHDV